MFYQVKVQPLAQFTLRNTPNSSYMTIFAVNHGLWLTYRRRDRRCPGWLDYINSFTSLLEALKYGPLGHVLRPGIWLIIGGGSGRRPEV